MMHVAETAPKARKPREGHGIGIFLAEGFGSRVRNSRVGFSLIELLVVLAIVVVLTGLLLSAVIKVRETAGRLKCQNNLRQIGLALHGYHEANGYFPPAFATSHQYEFLSWRGYVLPFAEQNALWSRIQAAYALAPLPWVDPPHPLETVVPLFGCPADERIRQPALVEVILPPSLGGGGVQVKVGLTSYLAVEGTDLTARDGVFFANSRIRIEDITDGTSHTVVVGERPPSFDLQFGWWYAGPGQNGTGSLDVMLGAREPNLVGAGPCPHGPYQFSPGGISDPCAAFHFWSLHHGGGNFLAGDGAVRFLGYAGADLLPALATRAGGETTSWE